MNHRRAAFFVGSGISLDSHAPAVNDITRAILDDTWQEQTDRRFSPGGTASAGTARRAQEFLRLLKAQIDPHLTIREQRSSNYEDLYAAALQIVQDEMCEIVNPLITGSVSIIQSAARQLIEDQIPHIDNNPFASLAERSADLIQWVVFHKLWAAVKPIGMDWLTLVADATCEMDIFSLNHDQLIERQFAGSKTPFADGFSDRDGDVIRFNWSWDILRTPVRLYKLHGSTDWYRFRFPQFVQYAKALQSPEHCKNSSGERLELLDPPNPFFLTGTTVKEQLYGISLVGELFSEFRTRLRRYGTLCCSGYGWSDKGINIRLNQWLHDAPSNRIVIFHNADPIQIKQKRFWFWRWEDYEKRGKLVIIPKWPSQCTLDDFIPFFDH